MIVTLADALALAKTNNTIGITDRDELIDSISRGIELAAFRTNWNPWVDTLDLCSGDDGCITLPHFVDTVLAANLGGKPAQFRNSWYEYHVNGRGSDCCGGSCGLYWDDKMWSPVFQNLTGWSLLAAVCEDAVDGNGSLELIVEGETMDANSNAKDALTIPVTGPSLPGVRVPLIYGSAATDPGLTQFRRIYRVTKPVTRGYVKLVAFLPTSGSTAAVLGYYGPNETTPWYRKMKVSCACSWVRIKYRRKSITPVNDYDVLPIASKQALVFLLKAIRFYDRDDAMQGDTYLERAIGLLNDVQTIEDGPAFGPIQVDPSFGVGTLDYR